MRERTEEGRRKTTTFTKMMMMEVKNKMKEKGTETESGNEGRGVRSRITGDV